MYVPPGPAGESPNTAFAHTDIFNTDAVVHDRARGAGRKSGLPTIEDKLLFVLVYTKTYPLQVVQGQLFGMSQPSANAWIHFLLPILAEALDVLGVMSERDGSQVAARERRQPDAHDLIVDEVERRRQRPAPARDREI